MYKKLILLSTLFFLPLYPIEKSIDPENNDETVNIMSVPGKANVGSENWYIEHLYSPLLPNINTMANANMPCYLYGDIGQGVCIKQLRKAMAQHKDLSFVIHATCQGTATAVNYLALEDKGKQIKGLILESMLISGNRSFQHVLDKNPDVLMNMLTYIPKYIRCSQIMVNCVQFFFTFYAMYWPGGIQPIKLVKQIPLDVPIIIIHSKEDRFISYDDVCAFYHALKTNGNIVYLISLEGSFHIRLLKHAPEEKKMALKNILKKHLLLNNNSEKEELNLEAYSPEMKQFDNLYDDILLKEKKIERISHIVLTFYIFLLARALFNAWIQI